MNDAFHHWLDAEDTEPPEGELIFEGTEPFAARRRRPPLVRAALTVLPIVLAVSFIFAGQSGLPAELLAAARGHPVTFTVLSDVPWAKLRVDDDPTLLAFHQDADHLYPAVVLHLTSGQHTLTITGEGFIPLTAQIGVGEHKINQFVAHPRLSSAGTQAALDAINRALSTSPYTQQVRLDAALWPALGLPAQPAAATLTSEQRFQAIALDPLQPTYFQTSYVRPITPAGLGSIGVAAVVVEVASISGDCATTLLAQRTAPVVSTRRAEVIFSLGRANGSWRAFAPYALTPDANLYTPPNLATLLGTDEALRALAARTALATALGVHGVLAAAVSARPLSVGTTSAGVILSLASGTAKDPNAPDAYWLFAADVLSALTPAALRFTPDVPLLPKELQATLEQGELAPAAGMC